MVDWYRKNEQRPKRQGSSDWGSPITVVSNYARWFETSPDAPQIPQGSLLGWTWSTLSPLSTILVAAELNLSEPLNCRRNGSQNLRCCTGLVVWLFFAGMIIIHGMARSHRRSPTKYFSRNSDIWQRLALAVQSAIEAGVLLSDVVTGISDSAPWRCHSFSSSQESSA